MVHEDGGQELLLQAYCSDQQLQKCCLQCDQKASNAPVQLLAVLRFFGRGLRCGPGKLSRYLEGSTVCESLLESGSGVGGGGGGMKINHFLFMYVSGKD